MEATNFLTGQSSVSSIPSLASATHLADAAINTTASLFSAASIKDIAVLPLRLAFRIDRAVFVQFPRYIAHFTGLEQVANRAGAVLAEYWSGGAPVGVNAGGAIAVMADAGNAAGAEAAGNAVDGTWAAFFLDAFHNSTFRSYWSMLHYLGSRWAFTCFLMALVLNRVNVYGATRHRINLTWTMRLALRLVPMLLFFGQIRRLLQAIQCQTSPEFSSYRHGDNNVYSLLDWSQDGGLMHTLSSTLLWSSDDQAACAAIGMSRPAPDVKSKVGSFSLLWPTFLRLSLSHLVENLSCSLQQTSVMTEVGMSVFEHSLAFAEAETMIAHALGVGAFSPSKSASNSTVTVNSTTAAGFIPASGTILAITDAAAALTGPHMLDRVNVPVEVLLVALLSCCNALSSHFISVIDKQRYLRLLNTGFWGLCFMSAFVWGFLTTSSMVRGDGGAEPRAVSGLLHFPTVAIVGFLPHMTVLFGILVCISIYSIALILTAISLGTNPQIRQPSRLSERISIAHDNLQAAMQIKGISVRWNEDFYTALLRLGFAALTAASEAVFLNEGRSVEMRQFTWLEEERLDELESSRSAPFNVAGHAHFQIAEEYGLPPSAPGASDRGGVWQSGYAKERKFDPKVKNGDLQANGSFVYPNPRADGVGALQRTARFYLLFIFLRGILFTVAGWVGYGIGLTLDRVGITARPRWLRRFVGKSLRQTAKDRAQLQKVDDKLLDFWTIDEAGKLALREHADIDIEIEMRGRVLTDHSESVEEVLDGKMYEWWKMGGWFGTTDNSGEYDPQSTEEDTTSIVSMSTAASESGMNEENEWESDSDGQRTPTQSSPNADWSFSNVPTTRPESTTPDTTADHPLDITTLVRLLNPQDRASREEAKILAAHLSESVEGRTMTRSRYRRDLERERSSILLAGRAPIHRLDPQNTSDSPPSENSKPLTPTEEAEVLESLILSRRKSKARPFQPQPSDADNVDSQLGPSCVVCQSQSRSIIAWPCRCLSVCEDCRVTLAMNNYSSCVTCRRPVGGFVRLWVP